MTAVLDAVAAATAAVPRLKPLNEQPEKDASGQVIYPYGVFTAVLGAGLSYTLESHSDVREGRVTVQTFGPTADGALTHMDLVVAALLDRRLAITGWATTPLRLELAPAVHRDPDATGLVGVTATFTFTATKE